MAKCIRCGKSTVVRGHVKLADSAICTPCFKSLGFKLNDTAGAIIFKYDDIKNGRDAYYSNEINKAAERYDQEHAADYDISTTHYSQLEAAGSTDNEIKIFSAICAVLEDEGYDTEPLQVTLGDKGSLFVMIDGVVILEYKLEPNVKWIRFPNESNEKVRIGGVRIINSLAPRICSAYDSAIGQN